MEEQKKKSRYTPAQAASAKKYLSHLAEIRIRMQPEQREEIKKRAAAAGKSVNQYLLDLALK